MQSMYVPDPVMSVSMKPKLPKDQDVFSKAIARFQKQVTPRCGNDYPFLTST